MFFAFSVRAHIETVNSGVTASMAAMLALSIVMPPASLAGVWPVWVVMFRARPTLPPVLEVDVECAVPFTPFAVESEIATAPSAVSFRCQTPA